MAIFSTLTDDGKKELWACLALRNARGIGHVRATTLVRHYTSAFAAVETLFADPSSWQHACSIPKAMGSSFIKGTWREAARQEWDAIQCSGHSFLMWTDLDYPDLLREIENPPLLLYYKGDVSLLHGPSIGIVGSRNCTREGVAVAAFFSRGLSRAGVTVVSGLAKGIDRAAHLAGLEGVGRSVAVLGTGIDKTYPQGNKDLEMLMEQFGLLITEFAPGTEAKARHFPERNRIISGLSKGILVVEAAARSGSLITARLALEQGREVFAVPGHTMASVSEGCRELIRQGAKVVFTADDLLVELTEELTFEARRALESRQKQEQLRKREPAPKKAAELSLDGAYSTAESVLPEGEVPWFMPDIKQVTRQARTREGSNPDKREELSTECRDKVGVARRISKPVSSDRVETECAPKATLDRLPSEETALLAVLADTPLHIDEIAVLSGMDVSCLSRFLLVLEVKGLITRRPGMLYLRKE